MNTSAEAYKMALLTWRAKLPTDPERLAEVRFAEWRLADRLTAAAYFKALSKSAVDAYPSEASAHLDMIAKAAGWDASRADPVRGTGPVAIALLRYLNDLADYYERMGVK